jgi:hypothetical protein
MAFQPSPPSWQVVAIGRSNDAKRPQVGATRMVCFKQRTGRTSLQIKQDKDAC